MTDDKAAALAAAVARLNDRLPDTFDAVPVRVIAGDVRMLLARIAELEANGVHSCHPECARPVCVLQRRVAELEAERAGLLRALRV